MTSLIRKISQTVGALAILGILSTSVASADQATTVAATTPATTASSTSPVAPDASSDVAQAGPLSDVPLNSWAYDAVNQLAKDGIIKGYPDGTFKGNRPMTRYEAAVLAYRAVDMLEAQITAGKAVEKADMDAANKMMAAFGNELKAVERHVDALQKQTDALGTTVTAQGKKLDATTALANATAATVRRSQVHMSLIFRSFAFGQNVTANAGPLPERFNGVTYGPGAALPTGIGGSPTGTGVTGSATTPGGIVTPGVGPTGGLSWGPNPNYGGNPNSATTGPYNHGLGYEGVTISFGGNPDDRSQWLVTLNQTDRYSGSNFYPGETPFACTSATIGVAGGACTAATAQAQNADGYLNNFVRMQNAWYQYTSPGGIYVKVGKFAQDEGPKQTRDTSWGLADYVDGARIGYRDSRINVQAGYGYEDTAAQQNLLFGLPFSSQVMWGEADFMLDKAGHTNIGGYYTNYSGFHQVVYDPYAVMCTGTGLPVGAVAAVPTSTSKVLPLLANQPYTAGGCGVGYQPIVYGAPGASAGLPITGSYLSTGAGAQAPHINMLGGFIVGNYGQLRIALDGEMRLGNDPTTGSKWLGNTSGYMQIDYGAYLAHPGVKGQYGLEIAGFAAGLNGLGAGTNYYQGPNWYTAFGNNYSGYYTAMIGVRKFLTDTAFAGVFFAHQGVLTAIPASSPQCPGCTVTGDSRNAVWGEVNMAF